MRSISITEPIYNAELSWETKDLTDEEIVSISDGEGLQIWIDVHGSKQPHLLTRLSRIEGITEISRMLLAGLLEHQEPFLEEPVEWIRTRFSLSKPWVYTIKKSLHELHSLGYLTFVDEGVVVEWEG